MLACFAPRPVTLRTLDVGGDKILPYFPMDEENSFLGCRGIRFSLDHPEILLIQMRAMLRANAGLNNMQMLFPMISRISEVDEALGLLARAYRSCWRKDMRKQSESGCHDRSTFGGLFVRHTSQAPGLSRSRNQRSYPIPAGRGQKQCASGNALR